MRRYDKPIGLSGGHFGLVSDGIRSHRHAILFEPVVLDHAGGDLVLGVLFRDWCAV